MTAGKEGPRVGSVGSHPFLRAFGPPVLLTPVVRPAETCHTAVLPISRRKPPLPGRLFSLLILARRSYIALAPTREARAARCGARGKDCPVGVEYVARVRGGQGGTGANKPKSADFC